MRKVAIFGKPGSGKSTLSKQLAGAIGLPLYPLDAIVYQANGDLVAREVFDQAHNKIITSDAWIIDGFGPMGAFFQRLESADTLIYIDFPYPVSYWFVIKRFLKGWFVKPEGWPEGSSLFKGTWQSIQTLRLCPKFWNHDFLEKLQGIATGKQLIVIRSVSELKRFISTINV